MTDRPIIFSAPMVRALREGRKTMTRRPLAPGNLRFFDGRGRSWRPSRQQVAEAQDGALDFRNVEGDVWTWKAKAYPHQAPATRTTWFAHVAPAVGDRLWVRETWQTGTTDDGPRITFKATPDYFEIDAWDGPDHGRGPSFNYEKCPGAEFCHWLGDVLNADGPWRSPIHMPRWASRLTLTVTAVRIERLQDIGEEDAIAEGCAGRRGPNPDFPDEWDPSPLRGVRGALAHAARPRVLAREPVRFRDHVQRLAAEHRRDREDRMTSDERKHVERIGAAAWAAALARASLVVRSDTRLIGLDRIRAPLAHHAALRATGFLARPVFPKVVSAHMTGEMQRICDELLARAIAAAKPAAEGADAA
ncbi:MAG: hypothetical protein M5U08_13820 [Burkholderiales bacterium]|nr:hypothetical protein [Burkholderiales bacterium]